LQASSILHYPLEVERTRKMHLTKKPSGDLPNRYLQNKITHIMRLIKIIVFIKVVPFGSGFQVAKMKNWGNETGSALDTGQN
jgi:hypothetical protein